MFNLIINFYWFLTIKAYDPLEQFDIFQIDFLVNNLFFFLILILIWNIFFLHNLNSVRQTKANLNTFLSYQLFVFTKNLLNANITTTKQFFLISYYLFFLIILTANTIGLIPYSFTVTSSFIITFTAAMVLLIVINVIAIYNNGFVRFIGFFLPKGTPLPIAIILVAIEIVSYIARLFSLSIRLFANMMAGHALLKILIGFSFTMLFSTTIFSTFAIFPWIIVSGIVVLEILIAMLQAYVFLILICIHCNDVLHLH